MAEAANPRAFFIRELQDMMFAERALARALPRFAAEAAHRELASVLEDLVAATVGHIVNLECVFEELGERSAQKRGGAAAGARPATGRPAAAGGEEPGPGALDESLGGAAIRAGSHVATAYADLVAMAEALGESDAAALLRENLERERAVVGDLERIADQLARKASREASAA